MNEQRKQKAIIDLLIDQNNKLREYGKNRPDCMVLHTEIEDDDDDDDDYRGICGDISMGGFIITTFNMCDYSNITIYPCDKPVSDEVKKLHKRLGCEETSLIQFRMFETTIELSQRAVLIDEGYGSDDDGEFIQSYIYFPKYPIPEAIALELINTALDNFNIRIEYAESTEHS